ncbi:hypothetical protein V500_01247 [Pseudogymnoascus sp. VKM F-4518 (FW-2643)]|nr:hypothetical protein V500_01247 [Pseudogymnoascus sp. VKM F-4518 (FW-2643)]
MPRPTAPPTPSSSTDLKSRDGSLFISSQMSFELPPPALTFDSRPSSTSAASSTSSYHPHSPMSNPQPAPPAKPRASTGRKRTSTAESSAKGAEPFDLPPPPTRTRKIIQMKPSAAPASAPSTDEQPAKAAAASKRKPPSATSAAGRKMARKTAHSLIERRRRSKMNEEFGVLKDMIPACKGEMHKLAILQASIEYVRYLEDCIAQLKSQNGVNTPTIASRRESTSIAPHSYAASSSGASEASHTDTEMTTAPGFTAPQQPAHHHQQQHHHNTQQPQQIPHQQPQPSQSPPLRAEDFQRTYSFSHSSSTSPAFGPQTYTGAPAWLGSAASSALTSPALGPMAEEETATVALMMLNGDWRMGEQREREGRGEVSGGVGPEVQRPRGMSVRDLLKAVVFTFLETGYATGAGVIGIGDMRTLAIFAAVAAVGVGAAPQGDGGQIVIGGGHASGKEERKLSGRFLHITGMFSISISIIITVITVIIIIAAFTITSKTLS